MPAMTIGILNNMADAAVRATERQYNDLLQRAVVAPDTVQVRWFSIQPRDGYETVAALCDETHLDGLIVTGIEPRARSLRDEPYWPALVGVIEWAARHTTATVFSCLAAHAAVLYLDGVLRHRLAGKLHGVFESTVISPSPLLAEMPAQWQFPHSRSNNLASAALRASGYRLLAESAWAGVDLFEKTCGDSLFWFIQSHPEYDARALMREFRRDVLRFLTGERDQYPAMPLHYFDVRTEQALRLLRDWAERERHPSVMVEMQLIVGKANLTEPWKADATHLYRNWLYALVPHQRPAVAAEIYT